LNNIPRLKAWQNKARGEAPGIQQPSPPHPEKRETILTFLTLAPPNYSIQCLKNLLKYPYLCTNIQNIDNMIVGLIRTLFLLVVFYYLFRFIFRFVVPLLLGNYMRNKMNGNQQSGNRNGYTKQRNTEGKVTIDYIPPAKKHIGKDEGDYVDYEEVKN